MAKYRKLPVVIEAFQYTGNNYYELKDWTKQVLNPVVNQKDAFFVSTLEGEMIAILGDYIIKGVNGEFYPCKPDIFEKTYEKVSED